jgi:oligoribonuclease NrnB/cAMP/cGMP phosphodiesterase (DHH superfamily)
LKPVLIYHADCPDGFGSRFAFWMKYRDEMEYIPAAHGRPIPENLEGRDIVFADFSYKPNILLDIRKKAKSLKIIDHHVSAHNLIKNLGSMAYDEYVYDINRSGASLCWSYLFPDKKVPNFINVIEDRDIWKWNVKDSKDLILYLDSFPYSIEKWQEFLFDFEPESSRYNGILMQGSAIRRYKDSTVEVLLNLKHKMVIDGNEIWAVNSPYLRDDIGEQLCVGEPFSAVYFMDKDQYRFSLRSSDSGIDVSIIASKLGGGGHRNAAGFTINNLNNLK